MEPQEIKSFLFISRYKAVLLWTIFVLITLVSGCSHSRDGTTVTEDVYGPQVPTSDQNLSTDAHGPPVPAESEVKKEDEGVVLLLPAAGMRSAAYIGVLKELKQHGIKINAIVASEMGAYVAALYAQGGINKLEWDYTKLKNKTLADLPMLGILGNEASGDALTGLLRSTLGKYKLESAKPKIYIVIKNDDGDVEYLSTGETSNVVRTSSAIEGLMKNGPLGKSAIVEAMYPVRFAKSLEAGKILTIDIMTNGEKVIINNEFEKKYMQALSEAHNAARSELSDSDWVITINTDDANVLDISKRAELAYRGRTATRAWVKGQKNK